MQVKKKKLASDMMWNTIGNIVYCICQWIITILVVHLSSYSDAGYLSLAMSTTSTFSTIALFNMRNYQVSDIKGDFKDDEYVGSRLLTVCFATACCLVSSINSTSTYQMLCIDAFMLIRISESLVDVFHGIDQKHEKYDVIGKSFLFRGILTVFSFSVGLLLTNNLAIAIVLTGVSNILVVLSYDLLNTLKFSKIKPILWNRNIKKLLMNCLPLMIISFLLSLIPLSARSQLQILKGNDILGKYASIASPTLIVQVFASYAFNPLVPRISVLFLEKRYDDFLSFLRKLIFIFIGFAFVIIFLGKFLGKFGLAILYGSSILEFYYLFNPLVICTLLTAYVWILTAIVTAIRSIVPMLVAMITSYLFVYFSTSRFIYSFGVNGASYVQIGGYSIFLVSLLIITIIKINRLKKGISNG